MGRTLTELGIDVLSKELKGTLPYLSLTIGDQRGT